MFVVGNFYVKAFARDGYLTLPCDRMIAKEYIIFIHCIGCREKDLCDACIIQSSKISSLSGICSLQNRERL